MPDLPKLEYIESQGTRWPVVALRYLLNLGEAELKAELQRLIGEADPVAEPTAEPTEPDHA